MTRIRIASIVEGKGEVEAVPILLRRIVREIAPALHEIDFPRPFFVPRGTTTKPGGIEKYVETAAQKHEASCAILILIDADDDCPKELAPQLLKRAQAARSDKPLAVVLAMKEYEAWFLAAAESLRGLQGLSSTMAAPVNPEAIRDAKGWLEKQMARDQNYAPRVTQPALTQRFDLTAARACDSFDKLFRDVERLLKELRPAAAAETE